MPILTSESVEQTVRECLRVGVPFAVYRRKGSADVYLFADDGVSAPLSDVRFFASPWDGGAKTVISDRLSVADMRAMATKTVAPRQESIEPSTPRDAYVASLNKLIGHLQENGGKTVISRVISRECSVEVASAAALCFERRRDATCCICTDAVGDVWLIASPELLVDVDYQTSNAETMSLAGTRPADCVGAWDTKNIEEHDIVTRYIAERMGHLGTDVAVSDDFTHNSATVSHLCSTITAKLRAGVGGADVAAYLSPTPAVCGVPVEDARSWIREIEQHPRRLYAGYFGIESAGHTFEAWVTLRCARVWSDGYCIYSGSGITADSVAEDEWAETAIKAGPLVDIFDNVTEDRNKQ